MYFSTQTCNKKANYVLFIIVENKNVHIRKCRYVFNSSGYSGETDIQIEADFIAVGSVINSYGFEPFLPKSY